MLRRRALGHLAWDPWKDMEEFPWELDRLLGRPLGRIPMREKAHHLYIPAADLSDGGERFVAKLDLPGVLREDLEISVEGGLLSIKGERKPDVTEEECLLSSERPVGRFVRMIELPTEIETGNVRATLRQGVLEIVLPKSRAAAREKVAVAVE
jgi:HSP20 family protein